jgi:hypothetical protein
MLADSDAGFETLRLSSDLLRLEAPKWIQVIVNLVKKVLDNERVLGPREFVPLFEAWWWMPTPTATIFFRCGLQSFCLLSKQRSPFCIGIYDELIDRMVS